MYCVFSSTGVVTEEEELEFELELEFVLELECILELELEEDSFGGLVTEELVSKELCSLEEFSVAFSDSGKGKLSLFVAPELQPARGRAQNPNAHKSAANFFLFFIITSLLPCRFSKGRIFYLFNYKRCERKRQ